MRILPFGAKEKCVPDTSNFKDFFSFLLSGGLASVVGDGLKEPLHCTGTWSQVRDKIVVKDN